MKFSRDVLFYKAKNKLGAGVKAIDANSLKVEFVLALIIAILLISSLLLEKYFRLPSFVPIILIIFFLMVKGHNLIKKSGHISLEDVLSITAIGIFFIVKIFMKRTPSAFMIGGIALILLYSIGIMPRIDSLSESRKISSFIASYVVFVLIIIFLFSTFYFTNNDSFMQQGQSSVLDFEDCFYFSSMTFTTVGYGDITPINENKIISIIEALTGSVMNIAFVGYILSTRKTY